MGRYSKNLSGVSQKVFVGTATYTDDTTFALFVANAPDGEMGVFLETGAVRSTALTATANRFFIAQKRDGFVNKTPILDFNDIIRRVQTDYVAPVKQVSIIGYNGTSGDLGFNFTGATPTNAQTYALTVRELTPGNQPFPIQEGYATVTSTTADEYTVLASIVSQLNGDLDYQRTQPDRFVKAEILSNGTVTALGQTLAVTAGSNQATAGAAVTLAAGSFLSIAGGVYKVAVAVAAGTAIVLDRPYQGLTATVASGTSATTVGTIAYTNGTTALGVRFTGLEFETIFKIAGNLLLQGDPITNSVAWVLGSGAGAQIVELEKQAAFFDGVGSPVNAAFSTDYGIPELLASSTGTYHQIFLDFASSITPASGVPTGYKQTQLQRILIAAPSSGTLESTLGTVFGV